MDARIRSVAVLLSAAVALTACRTLQRVEYPEPTGSWKHTTTSRWVPDHEAYREVGALAYRGRDITAYFSTVVIGERRYDYSIRRDPLSFEGYREAEGFAPAHAAAPAGAAAAGAAASPEDIRRGWYFAPLGERRGETPASWIWVKRENLESYLDPNRLEPLARRYELLPITGQLPREPEVMFHFGWLLVP